ncbi:hypothetical protein C8R47DRAFT_1227514 [Mycena vitilis]|nr:hypothetical protein C8R47DRAFT_1227514 [Mycena vitilis]
MPLAVFKLDEEDDYKVMFKSAAKCKDPMVNLVVEMLRKRKKDESDDDTVKGKKPKKKSKIPSENDVLPANADINAKIALLRTKWTCHANDGSDYCWISGEEKEHVHLGNPHFNMWAAAWAHGSCDEETPPNHGIFATKHGAKLAPPSLLQRRAAGNQAAAPAAPTINNHINIPDGFLDLVRPRTAVAAPPPVAPQPSLISHHSHPMLLPANTGVGPPMTIIDFCTLYELDAEISAKFSKNGYKNAGVFFWIKIAG